MRFANLLPAALTEDWQHGGFGLYIHWPFCEAKCPYCDFNSHVSRQIDQNAWCAAYLLEIKRVAALTPGRVLNSVYFGGGTPSLMDVATVEAILIAVSESWTLANDIEITLEANPSSVEVNRFRSYRNAGVNRVSLGVQALNNPDLRRLGRIHSVDEALRAVEISQNVFERSSFDLIYARQSQSLADWEAELMRALSWNAGHLSLYQLTIENGTAFGDRYNTGKLRGLPDEDLSADMYELTQQICAAAGLPAYEVSNHAVTGNESRHNLIYWRYGDYAGIGPGAHGRLTLGGQKHAVVAASNPSEWLRLVSESRAERTTRLTYQDLAVEYLMMGLRINELLDLERLKQSTGVTLAAANVNSLAEIGMLEIQHKTIAVTAKGRPVLNSIIAKLVDEIL